MDGEKILIKADVSDERRSDGFVIVKTFHQTQKTQVALRKLALFWGLAILSILIPVFHFILVPLFFGLGIFFAVRGYKSEGEVLNGATTCPHCNAEVIIGKGELNWPLKEICQSCARVVRIEKAQI